MDLLDACASISYAHPLRRGFYNCTFHRECGPCWEYTDAFFMFCLFNGSRWAFAWTFPKNNFEMFGWNTFMYGIPSCFFVRVHILLYYIHIHSSWMQMFYCPYLRCYISKCLFCFCLASMFLYCYFMDPYVLAYDQLLIICEVTMEISEEIQVYHLLFTFKGPFCNPNMIFLWHKLSRYREMKLISKILVDSEVSWGFVCGLCMFYCIYVGKYQHNKYTSWLIISWNKWICKKYFAHKLCVGQHKGFCWCKNLNFFGEKLGMRLWIMKWTFKVYFVLKVS